MIYFKEGKYDWKLWEGYKHNFRFKCPSLNNNIWTREVSFQQHGKKTRWYFRCFDHVIEYFYLKGFSDIEFIPISIMTITQVYKIWKFKILTKDSEANYVFQITVEEIVKSEKCDEVQRGYVYRVTHFKVSSCQILDKEYFPNTLSSFME